MQGQPFAQYRLARAYIDGWPVKKDMAKGLKWLSRSAMGRLNGHRPQAIPEDVR